MEKNHLNKPVYRSKRKKISLFVKAMINKRKEFPGSLEVKDSALSLLWLRFSPWPGNFCHNEEQKDKHEDVKKDIKIIKCGEGK